jgi:hypothetical protein
MYNILKAFLIASFICCITNENVRENFKKKFFYYWDKFCSEIYFEQLRYLLYYDGDDDFLNINLNDKTEEMEDKKEVVKIEIKYEDKYLVEIRKMDKEYVFTDEEKEKIIKKTGEIYNNLIIEYKDNRDKLLANIQKLEEKLARYEGSSDDEYCDIDEDGCDDLTKEEKVNNFINEKNEIVEKYEKICFLIDTVEGEDEIMEKARKDAIVFIINERLDLLRNNFVMEKTPNGNVLLFWNNKRGTFEYYSDNTIPYRYLEPVGRKYVKMFNCRHIFVDMEEELILSEERFKKEKEEKERKELEEKNRLEEAKNNNTSIIPEKKSVFTKFKSYNKEAGSGRVNMVAPPKNSIPNKSVTETDNNGPVLLKDRANRYTYEGKLSNFNFLKKIERKVVDKKFSMSFADFKKNILMKNK